MLLSLIAIVSAGAGLGFCLSQNAFDSYAWVWQLPVSFIVNFLILVLIAFLILCGYCATIDLDAPQGKDDPFTRKFVYPYLGLICSFLGMRITTEGLEKLPKDGRFLLICNHLSDLDVVVLLRYFTNAQLAFISKKENRTMFIVGKIMHRISCQMIDRENDREALKTILKCIQMLKEDEVNVAVFPEGYESKDGLLQNFRPGVFKIAQKAQVPIVVCTLTGMDHIFHNIKRLRKTDVTLHLVDVVPAEDLKGQTAVQISNRCHALMAGDLGPALVAAAQE